MVRVAKTEGRELSCELRRQLRKLLPSVGGPVVVSILWQQLAAVEGERRTVGRGCPRATRVGSSKLQAVDVDVRCELEQLIPDLDRAAVKRAPRDVHGLIQVVRRRGRIAVAPERIHRLLAVEAPARS